MFVSPNSSPSVQSMSPVQSRVQVLHLPVPFHYCTGPFQDPLHMVCMGCELILTVLTSGKAPKRVTLSQICQQSYTINSMMSFSPFTTCNRTEAEKITRFNYSEAQAVEIYELTGKELLHYSINICISYSILSIANLSVYLAYLTNCATVNSDSVADQCMQHY